MPMHLATQTLSRKEQTDVKSYPGEPFPLGATWDGQGVNFALYAENATGVELCLFNSTNTEKKNRTGCGSQKETTMSGMATSLT